MSVQFRFDGLDELRAALRSLPETLTLEASHVIDGWGNAAVVSLRSEYGAHTKTGNLQSHVVVQPKTKGLLAGLVVRSTAKHSHLFERGTKPRFYISKTNTRHETGVMWARVPAPHTFVRTMLRIRLAMFRDLADLLRRHGLIVTGTP